MSDYRVSREDILGAVRRAVEPLDFVHAMWEGGAAANGRLDEWSDIDLMVDAEEDHIEKVFDAVESAFESLSSIELRYRMREPTWHGHSQALYRLAGSSPFHMVDFCVVWHSKEDKLLGKERHGTPVVHFDKTGTVTSPPLDLEAHSARLRERLAAMRVMFDLTQIMTEKEIHRGNGVEAMAYYQGLTLRPLVEALRMLHDPLKFDYQTRYVYEDFPRDVVTKLEPLYFIRDLEDLRVKLQEAGEWFGEIMNELGDGPEL